MKRFSSRMFVFVSLIILIILVSPSILAAEMTVSIGTGDAEAGDIVTIPVSFQDIPAAGINGCDFRVAYDSNVLEAVSVTPGSIVPRPNIDFYSSINSEDGIISFLFADEEQQQNYLIYDDGVFANLEFRVMDNAPVGVSEIGVSSVGAFVDYDLNIYTVYTQSGGINVGDGNPPLPPTLNSAEAGDSQVALDWSSVGNADGYTV
ncbi:MAG: cohesin domain-containing protein, partial [bacterium]